MPDFAGKAINVVMLDLVPHIPDCFGVELVAIRQQLFFHTRMAGLPLLTDVVSWAPRSGGMNTFCAVVLAAGEANRIGFPQAPLPMGGKYVLGEIVGTVQSRRT